MRMLSLLLVVGLLVPTASALQLAAAASAAPAPVLEWDEVSDAAFDLRWRLPSQPGGAERDLVTQLKSLFAKRYDAPDGMPWATGFGDVVAELSTLSPRDRDRRLDTLRREAPALWRDMGATLADLLSDDLLTTTKWNPSNSSDTDGFIEGPSFDAKALGGAPWSRLRGATKMYQVATLIDADIESIKGAENDFESYYTRPHAAYEEIYRVDGSYRVGSTPEGGPFAVVKVYFRCDLPWPFGDYDGVLNGISTLDADDCLLTDFYVTSDDFYWMAGRDTCLPVFDSDGAWVTTVLIRQAGFDLSGVPDGSDERVASSRGVLGNVKRLAEKMDAEREGPPVLGGSIPTVR